MYSINSALGNRHVMICLYYPLISSILVAVVGRCQQEEACRDVFISEVQEGSGYNKSLEIFNVGGWFDD